MTVFAYILKNIIFLDADTQNVIDNPYFEKSEMVFKQTAELSPLLKCGSNWSLFS